MKLVSAALVIVLAGGTAGAQDPAVDVEVFSVVAIIDHPDSFGLMAMHLNDKDEVAGRFKTGPRCDYPEVSFVWSDGAFRYVAVPDAYTTRAEGTNVQGAVTGSYIADPIVWNEQTQSCGTSARYRQGFVVSPEGQYRFLPWDSLHSIINNITSNGWMTGPTAFCDWTAPGCLHGYLYDGSDWRLLDPPGCEFTDAVDVNARGDVAGYCWSEAAPLSRGYRFSQGSYEFIDFPGATETSLSGINNAGDLVGSARIPEWGVRPFVLREGRFAVIELADYEWAWMVAWGINDSGAISGYVLDSDGRQKGFVARPLRPDRGGQR